MENQKQGTSNQQPRTAHVRRETRETQIGVDVNLDGTGEAQIDAPLGFLVHMLETLARHGLFNLNVEIAGDLHTGAHHTVEDTGIVLGQAFKEALGDKRGIHRAGHFAFPMDEALAEVALDISGRGHLVWHVAFQHDATGDVRNELWEDFFSGFAQALGLTLHVRVPYGRSDHHKIEAVFKATARALRAACSRDARNPDAVPSTKGVL